MLDVTIAYGLTYLFPTGDSAVGLSLRNHGEFARPEADLISAYLDHAPVEPTFIDVGANIGAICLPVAARHAGAKVIALEAQRRIHGVLCANALNNRLFNVECHHLAAGPREGLMSFPSFPLTTRRNFGDVGSTGHASAQSEPVQVRALDTFVEEPVAFVKIDVQGAEIDVLEGSKGLIARHKPALLLEVTRSKPDETARVAAFMQSLGYRLFVFFSPFATATSDKPMQEKPSYRGDFSFLALAPLGQNLWDLPEFKSLDDPWPTDLADFAYLKSYYSVP